MRYHPAAMTESEKPPASAASAAAKKPKPKLKARRRAPVVEETPVIGGRFLTAAALIGACALATRIINVSLQPATAPRAGSGARWTAA